VRQVRQGVLCEAGSAVRYAITEGAVRGGSPIEQGLPKSPEVRDPGRRGCSRASAGTEVRRLLLSCSGRPGPRAIIQERDPRAVTTVVGGRASARWPCSRRSASTASGSSRPLTPWPTSAPRDVARGPPGRVPPRHRPDAPGPQWSPIRVDLNSPSRTTSLAGSPPGAAAAG
jgi:hypothetical protein